MHLSPAYLALLEHEHATTQWGTAGWTCAPKVWQHMEHHQLKSVLDYGSGRGSFGHWFQQQGIKLELQEFEPGRASGRIAPAPAQVVVCIDVLEHVEPEHLEAVLDTIQSLAQHSVYFNIGLKPASRILQDGRNAHLTLLEPSVWQSKLCSRWQELSVDVQPNGHKMSWVGLVRT